jgi:heme-degrading monooxygenase HmoA
MIVAIVRFPLPAGMTAEAARASFEASAPSYQGLPGLRRKYYLRATDGSEGGGVYLWDSKDAAEAVYTDAWRQRLADRFGSVPRVEYLDCPVVVDPDQIIVE